MAQSFNTSLKQIAAQYARMLNLRVTRTSLQKDLEEHPYYPSLLSLSDTFNKYNVVNYAFNVNGSEVYNLETPFIAWYNTEDTGNDFILVKSINVHSVHFIYADKEQQVSKEHFLKNYRKIVWAAEPDENSGELAYESKLKKERITTAKRMHSF